MWITPYCFNSFHFQVGAYLFYVSSKYNFLGSLAGIVGAKSTKRTEREYGKRAESLCSPEEPAAS